MASIKHRWYESDEKVVIEIPMKNISEDDFTISYAPETLNVSVKLEDGKIFELGLHLLNETVPDKSYYKIRQTKVEIHLQKKIQSRWGNLEKEQQAVTMKLQSKNWDKVVKENWSDKDDEGGNVDQLFAKIYESGNDEQKKAMLKSFTESGGTVLSTNWSEVGSKKVEVKAPDGMEYVPWNK